MEIFLGINYQYFFELLFIYFFSLNVMIACEVQDFAKTHGMLELQQICEFVMAVNINVESVMRYPFQLIPLNY